MFLVKRNERIRAWATNARQHTNWVKGVKIETPLGSTKFLQNFFGSVKKNQLISLFCYPTMQYSSVPKSFACFANKRHAVTSAHICCDFLECAGNATVTKIMPFSLLTEVSKSQLTANFRVESQLTVNPIGTLLTWSSEPKNCWSVSKRFFVAFT